MKQSPNSSWARAFFRRSGRWTLLPLVVVCLALTAGTLRAAPSQQTQTPTPTETLPALPPPPLDGGVVAVETLAVRDGPGEEFDELGGLPYGAFIYPEARTQDTRWLQIEYAGFEGWVLRPLVNLAYDPIALPVPPGLVTAVPGTTPEPPPDATSDTAVTPTPAPSPDASDATVTLTPTPEPTATTEAVPDTPVPAAEPESPPGAQPDIDLGRTALIVAGALGALVSVRYLFAASRSARLQGAITGAGCPACQEGTLSMEGRGRTQRVVQCDNCRSVLRRQRGRKWRYAVDPLAGKEFADQHNSQTLTEEELLALIKERGSREARTA